MSKICAPFVFLLHRTLRLFAGILNKSSLWSAEMMCIFDLAIEARNILEFRV